METKRAQKALMGLFSLRSRVATAPLPRARLGKTEISESLVLTPPRPGAGPVLPCPKGDPGAEIQFKERGGVPPLPSPPPLWWTTPPRCRRDRDACLERRATAKPPNIRGQDGGHASTGPARLFQRTQISGALRWTELDFGSADTT